MSNLSDLLPAGAGGKQVDFVASGTISNGVTVGLNSDGTVTAVASDAIPQAAGSAQTYTSVSATENVITYDSAAGKVVVAYRDSVTTYGMAVVGTVTGTSISFGTPVAFESANTSDIAISFDTANSKVVISYRDIGNSSYGTSIVGTVSGTSISFGSPVVFLSGSALYLNSDYDSTSGKIVIGYQAGATNYGTAIIGTVSGTSISFGSSTVFESATTYNISVTYDFANDKTVIAYRDVGNSNYGTAIVGTVSGTSISFGTPTVFNSGISIYMSSVYDSDSNQVVIAYRDGGNSNYGTAIVGTVSGTSISFGSEAVFNSGATWYVSIAYNSSVQKVVISYGDDSALNDPGTVIEGTVSGTSISYGSPLVFELAQTTYINSIYDSGNNKIVISYTDDGNSSYGTGIVVQNESSNYESFIGISDAAISDTASGSVTIKGGIAGSVAYSSGPGAITDWTTADYTYYSNAMTYDANAQKLVIFYPSGNNTNHGYYVVGTVSGISLSFGTPGLVSAVPVSWQDITYDANAQKVVAVYNNGNDSDHGYAVVGTVSGTSITWGTPVKFEAAGVYYNSITYDSNSQKVVISYMDAGNSYYGTSIVGTVSGTSISFGTAVVFESANTSFLSSVYDSTSNKIVISYKDNGNSGYGTAIVGTVSGTSISFGTSTVFEAASTSVTDIAYDANADKVVVAYIDNGNSGYGTAVVGTVSGTSISFGTPVVFQASTVGTQFNDITAHYDPSTQTVLIGFRDTGDSNYGKTVVGTVSGTSISFDSPVTFSETNSQGILISYASSEQKMVVAFDSVGTTPDTKAFVYTPDTTLTPNTNYYVQSDGSLSTTSSSVLAGKALSSTSINLDYTT